MTKRSKKIAKKIACWSAAAGILASLVAGVVSKDRGTEGAGKEAQE